MTALTIPLPDQIKDAAKHGELVLFVGAGASQLCGSPDWTGFAKQVVDKLRVARSLSFLEAEQLNALGDARRTLSIAMAIAKENAIGLDFDGILHPARPLAAGVTLYEQISSLRPVFVTTNYDKWLDSRLPETTTVLSQSEDPCPPQRSTDRPKYWQTAHITPDRLTEREAVIHLHGSYTEPDSMVVPPVSA